MSTLAVARLVRRELLRRPLHVALLLVAAGLILLSRTMVAFGFGEEKALIELSGLEAIAAYAFAVAVLFGAGSVGRDMDSRLLVSILARPISRGSYLLGRFLGLFQTLCMGAVPLVLVLVLAVAFASSGPVGATPDADLAALVVGVVLALVQAAALAAAVLAVSVMVPSGLSLVISLLLAAGGLLAEPARHALPADSSTLVEVVTRILALVLPPVSRPGEGSEIAFGSGLPFDLVVTRVARSALYTALALVLATLRLERKDLT